MGLVVRLFRPCNSGVAVAASARGKKLSTKSCGRRGDDDGGGKGNRGCGNTGSGNSVDIGSSNNNGDGDSSNDNSNRLGLILAGSLCNIWEFFPVQTYHA